MKSRTVVNTQIQLGADLSSANKSHIKPVSKQYVHVNSFRLKLFILLPNAKLLNDWIRLAYTLSISLLLAHPSGLRSFLGTQMQQTCSNMLTHEHNEIKNTEEFNLDQLPGGSSGCSSIQRIDKVLTTRELCLMFRGKGYPCPQYRNFQLCPSFCKEKPGRTTFWWSGLGCDQIATITLGMFSSRPFMV